MQPRSKHKQRRDSCGDNAPSSFEFIWMCWWMNVLHATATNPRTPQTVEVGAKAKI